MGESRMNKPKVLFILKRREDYSTDIKNFTDYTIATGMYSSSTFVSNMLKDSGVESKVVIVIDNNDIDREVSSFKPTHVFIEGFWVVPEKFDVLIPLHKNVKWVVRCHSEMPFLAQEGIAMGWVFEYLKRGVVVSGNNPRINRELKVIAYAGLNFSMDKLEKNIPLLTNYYPINNDKIKTRNIDNGVINIGCFGAFRPMKNQLSQAVAAIEFAEQYGLKLRFHVNTGRLEMNGANPLKNIRSLFENVKHHELIEHPWTSHSQFLGLIGSMDLNMQVSFSETFNIVSADSINMGVPILVSSEIPWATRPFADPTSTVDMVEKLSRVMFNSECLVIRNKLGIKRYSERSRQLWLNFLLGKKESRKEKIEKYIKNFFANIFS